jgi:hypothetical protein
VRIGTDRPAAMVKTPRIPNETSIERAAGE